MAISQHVEQNVLFIYLNRPEKYNSVNKEMALSLQKALDDAAQNKDIRVVYISGQGKGFCAGQDLGEATGPEAADIQKIVNEHYNPLIEKIRNLPQPVIAAVNGVAAGAGANIALACDIVVANEAAVFIQAFSKIALIPDSGGTYFLPRLIGLQKAMALMLLGDKVTAAEAEAMGMIYKYFPNENFEEESKKMAFRLAQQPQGALQHTKSLLNQTFNNNLSEQLLAEEKHQTICGQSADFKEGIAAFLEKRNPVFNQ